jgi:hypothetical protein
VNLLCSTHPSSLGLHPALYFYSQDGSFQSTALFNLADWFVSLEARGKINDFLKVRQSFESLALNHPAIIKPPVHALGSGIRTKARAIALYDKTFALLLKNNDPETVWNTIIEEPDFAFLRPDEQELKKAPSQGAPGKAFHRKAKSAAYFAQALPVALKCPLCGGLLHKNAMVGDHIEEKMNGGSSASSNSRVVHPVCNSNRVAMGI